MFCWLFLSFHEKIVKIQYKVLFLEEMFAAEQHCFQTSPGNCWTATTKQPTCVGIIVSSMLFIVSLVSRGEVVLLFSLLSKVGVRKLGGVGVPPCCDSLPKVLRAFSEKRENYRTRERIFPSGNYSCTCLCSSTSLTHSPFTLTKHPWDHSLYLI